MKKVKNILNGILLYVFSLGGFILCLPLVVLLAVLVPTIAVKGLAAFGKTFKKEADKRL